MKTIKIDRWECQIEIQVPRYATVFESRTTGLEKYDPVKGIEKALKNPYGMEPIKKLVNAKSRVAVAFDNPIKPSPSFFAIPLILQELRESGVKNENIVLVSANGTQRKHTADEFIDYRRRGYGAPPGRGSVTVPEDIFKDFWPHRFIRNDAADTGCHVHMGFSRLGDLIEVNRIISDSDLTIYTGGVNPMAWGGIGGSGVVIGLGSARSIASHHTYGVIGRKESCHADPETNAFRKHKEAAMERIEETIGRKIFYLDGVLNGAGQWSHFFAGHYKEIQKRSWEASDSNRVHEVKQADVIVAGLPKWILYDTTRNPLVCLNAAAAILRVCTGKPVLREGGVIILIAECDGQIDTDALPSYPEVIDLYGETGNARRLEQKYLEEFLFYRPEYLRKHMAGNANHPVHPFWLFAETQFVHEHVGKLIIATAENPLAVRKVGGVWAEDFRQAWHMAEKIVGKNPRTIILPRHFTGVPLKFAVK